MGFLFMIKILQGDCLERLRELPDESIQCCVTSPPYWGLRDYGVEDQLGLEKTPEEYVAKMVEVFREVRRVLRDDGTLWLNLGDSYAGGGNYRGVNPDTLSEKQGSNRASHGLNQKCGIVDLPPGLKPKDLVGIPWRVAFALQADGWYLRSDIIWHKPNPMPESVTDRPTKSHEYIFLMSKSARYYYDAKSIMESAAYGEQHANKATSWGTNRKHPNKANVADYAFTGDNHTCHKSENGEFQRNKRTVWTVATSPYSEAHFATFPPDLIKPCILAGTKPGDTVLDPFGGSGTTGQVALELGRKAVLIELNPEYIKLIEQRTNVTPGLCL